MTAASVELLTRAGARLLLRCSISVNYLQPGLQVLGQHYDARKIVFPSPRDITLSPVSPDDVLLKDSRTTRPPVSVSGYTVICWKTQHTMRSQPSTASVSGHWVLLGCCFHLVWPSQSYLGCPSQFSRGNWEERKNFDLIVLWLNRLIK